MGKRLYKQLILSGREERCEICGTRDWQNQPLVLQVHHKDGNRRNNSLDNLQILCPNCHSQTDNFCSKNRKISKKLYYCSVCGKQLSEETKTGLCRDCWNKEQQKRSNKPNKEELIKKCEELKSYSKVSKEYNVSDKTIRKWCESYNFLIKDLNGKRP